MVSRILFVFQWPSLRIIGSIEFADPQMPKSSPGVSPQAPTVLGTWEPNEYEYEVRTFLSVANISNFANWETSFCLSPMFGWGSINAFAFFAEERHAFRDFPHQQGAVPTSFPHVVSYREPHPLRSGWMGRTGRTEAQVLGNQAGEPHQPCMWWTLLNLQLEVFGQSSKAFSFTGLWALKIGFVQDMALAFLQEPSDLKHVFETPAPSQVLSLKSIPTSRLYQAGREFFRCCKGSLDARTISLKTNGGNGRTVACDWSVDNNNTDARSSDAARAAWTREQLHWKLAMEMAAL